MILTCGKCKFHYITHDQKRPWGCNKFGFKSSSLPFLEVKASTGMDCAYFTPKVSILKRERKRDG